MHRQVKLYPASGETDQTFYKWIKLIAGKRYFYGYLSACEDAQVDRKIWAELRKKIKVNHKKVYRLYRIMNPQKPVPSRRKKATLSTAELTELGYPLLANGREKMDY